MEKEVVITYETLFEILRREKAREELQKLPENFSSEVKKYLHEKKQTMLTPSDDPFSEIEQEKTQRQISNIKKILNDLYERREKKIISMALNKSRMPKSVIETATFAPSEKQLYEKLFSVLNDSRYDTLRNMMVENAVFSAEPNAQKTGESLAGKSMETAEKPEEPKTAIKPEASPDTQKVKFMCDVSQFVGPNLEIYGPFRSDEMAVLPSSVCTVLISKNKAKAAENDEQEG